MSSESIGSGLQKAGASSTKSSHQMSRSACQGTSWPVRLATITVVTVGHSLSASSALPLRGTVVPRRYPPSEVMSTRDFASLMRSRRESGEKPPNTTLCGAPMRAQASMATTTSGIIGM